MYRHIGYGGVVVAAVVALGGLGAGGAGAPATAGQARPPAGHAALAAGQPGAFPGKQLWTRRYNSPNSGYDEARAVVVSPAGDRVFVTGTGGTVAYDAATGAKLWAKSNDPAIIDHAESLAVSPAGGTVFVTGADSSGWDYATVAYDAATGAQLWAKHYNPFGGDLYAYSVAVSPRGDRVFVTGTAGDYATVAYNAATGAQLWAKRYNGPAGLEDDAYSVAVSPNGSTVVVTGVTGIEHERPYAQDYATVAYNAATGAQLWAKVYNGPAGGNDDAASVAVSRGRVFVTGTSAGKGPAEIDYATVAYDAATGAQLWVKRYTGPGNGGASAVAVSPSGGTVYIAGTSTGATSEDYATVAYNAATGAQLWARRYNSPANSSDDASSVAVSPSGGTVYITGTSYGATSEDYATVAYNAATGAQLWARRYNSPANGNDRAYSVAVSPSGDRVFVTGASSDATGATDYVTIAYSG